MLFLFMEIPEQTFSNCHHVSHALSIPPLVLEEQAMHRVFALLGHIRLNSMHYVRVMHNT